MGGRQCRQLGIHPGGRVLATAAAATSSAFRRPTSSRTYALATATRSGRALVDLVVVRDRTPLCRAGRIADELLDQCPRWSAVVPCYAWVHGPETDRDRSGSPMPAGSRCGWDRARGGHASGPGGLWCPVVLEWFAGDQARSTVPSFQQPSSRTTTSQESWARYTHMYALASAGEVDNRPLVLLSRRSMLVKRL
jgi:hypothetical protein